jgi:uncharacterized protein (TIGR02271 family)
MQTSTDPAQLYDCDVFDTDGNKIGSVDGVWVDDATNDLEFISAKTGGLFGGTHMIPLADAQISDGSITVPYGESQIKDAPSYPSDQELTPEQENEIYGYYGIQRTTAPSPTGLPAGGTTADYQSGTSAGYQGATGTDTTLTDQGQTEIPLTEEELQVGKREVEAGRVRLRKVVRTEHQEVPVELRREDVEIERIPASEVSATDSSFDEGTIEVPVTREEPVVGKEAHVTGGVRVSKTAETETRPVGGEVRKEDVEVDRDVDTDFSDRTP